MTGDHAAGALKKRNAARAVAAPLASRAGSIGPECMNDSLFSSRGDPTRIRLPACVFVSFGLTEEIFYQVKLICLADRTSKVVSCLVRVPRVLSTMADENRQRSVVVFWRFAACIPCFMAHTGSVDAGAKQASLEAGRRTLCYHRCMSQVRSSYWRPVRCMCMYM